MRKRHLVYFFLTLFLMIPLNNAISSTEMAPLLRVLIKKGIITREEAIEIQKEAQELEKKEELKEQKLETSTTPKAFKGLKFKVLSYLDYSVGQVAESNGKTKNYNRFSIKRGYFRVYKTLTPWLHGHLTLDVHQDEEGDWKARLKYLYAELRPMDLGFFTDMKAEIGMGHIPWLDFEEHINPYRCQGTMAIERAGTFNSADLGISVRGYFGGQLEDVAIKTGDAHYAGRFGSWHIGLYNGAGYHSKEKNGNKVIEGRITIRPLPDFLPGLQLSYFGLTGEGNEENTISHNYPDYRVHMGFLSYEHPRFIFTAQYFTTKGNKDGKWIDLKGRALWTENYSFFANVKPPLYFLSNWLDKKLNFFFRYDHVNRDKNKKIASHATYNLYIGGGALEIFKGNYVLMDYEYTDYGRDFGNKHSSAPVPDNNPGNEHKLQMVYQLKF